jgi:hypothetical protein
VSYPAQGKIHSNIVEYNGALYFGTHLSRYSETELNNYPGGHVVSYNLATGSFRDLGILRKNYGIYSALGIDRVRDYLYVMAFPCRGNASMGGTTKGTVLPGEGPRLFRVRLADGVILDLGLLHQGDGQDHHLYVDASGDVWMSPFVSSGSASRG